VSINKTIDDFSSQWTLIYQLLGSDVHLVESINIEILIADKKWLISGVYRPQTIDEKMFSEDFIKTCDQITIYN
jgi:hypothetical protein